MATWGTVTLTNGDEARLTRFVRHHNALGADEIRLYFDDPDAPHFETIAAMKNVVAIRCDDAFWAGDRPKSAQVRQKIAVLRAFRAFAQEWMAHVDDDEAIIARRRLKRLLGRVKPDALVVHMPPLERVFSLPPRGGDFSGHYKRRDRAPRDRLLRRLILGRWAVAFNPFSFISHHQGKSIFRVGADITPRIHRTEEQGVKTARPADLLLLHAPVDKADDIRRRVRGRAAGAKDHPSRLGTEGVQVLARRLLETGRDESDLAFRRLVRLNPLKIALLRAAGLVVRIDVKEWRGRRRP